ncbi:MAG: DegV family protein [Oscillospiraceae bacterium]|nr:DegV family protein [Oscillospiraceae bacterium]
MDKKFIILCDGSCDLTRELREKYDIEYMAGVFSYPDGTEEVGFLDWADCQHIPNCTSEIFYDLLKKNPTGFKTAPVSPQACYREIEKYVKQGYGVMTLSLSQALSGAYSFVLMAKQDIEKNYPDAEVYCIDSRRYACAIGLLAIHASMLRSEGKSLKETVDYIEANKIRFHQAGWVDDLSYLAKQGRLTNSKAFFGSLIGLKPIGELDSNGLTTVIAKVKGEKLAFKVLLSYMELVGEDLGNQVIVISQSSRRKQAETYKRMIEERFHPKAVYISDVFPLTGVNIGPGLMAAYFVGKPISEGLVAETEAINKAIELSTKE